MAASDTTPSDVAEQVRMFYDRHPYPPPVENLDRYGQGWDDERRRVEELLFWPASQPRPDRRILIAGCGTSQAARYALRWPGAHVTGIDVSRTSITRTEQLKQRHGLNNLELRVLPVERVEELAGTFDYIVSTGVLHHLPDPDTALQALRRVLAPGGALHLMLYAPYGRAGIYLLQDYCRRLGIGTTAAEIRDLTVTLRALPPDHPLVPLLRDAPDFRTESALADRYSIRRIAHIPCRSFSTSSRARVFDSGDGFARLPICRSAAPSARRHTARD